MCWHSRPRPIKAKATRELFSLCSDTEVRLRRGQRLLFAAQVEGRVRTTCRTSRGPNVRHQPTSEASKRCLKTATSPRRSSAGATVLIGLTNSARLKLIEKIIYGAVAIASGGAAIVAAFVGNITATSVSILMAFLFLFAAKADRISRFKASFTGVEAETRALIQRAEVTLEQVRGLAVITAQLALSLIARIGRVDSY